MSNENNVALPEPECWYDLNDVGEPEVVWNRLKPKYPGNWRPLFAEQQVRALLATATGLPAQAATEDERAAWFALAMNAAAYIEDAAACLRDGDAKRAATGAAKHVREKCNALWDSAPQSQADARDAGYRKIERRISMTPVHMDKPAEVRVTWSFGDKEPKTEISGWHINGHGTSLPGNPDAAIHGACNLLLDELERTKTGVK